METKDLENLSDKELLEELANSVMEYEESIAKLIDWEAVTDYDEQAEYSWERNELVENKIQCFNHLKQVLQFVKKDSAIWE